MFEVPYGARLWITAGVLLGASVLLQTVSHGEPIIPRKPLRQLPYTLGQWSARELPIQAEILQVVGVTDYMNRSYADHGEPDIQLYIGYYASQRTGDTIHSPKNCLPGAGWDPIQSGYATISLVDGTKLVVNEYIIQQDQNKQLVFYWYQGRGRIIANEYVSKFWMVVDAISRNRTDSALIRMNTPMNDGELRAHARLTGFTQLLYPQLGDVIPD